jgi:predicted ABC-type ATPase
VEGINAKAKTIEIVAGPNGSGKTTFAESYFLRTKQNQVFLNPDLIAAGISPMGSDISSFKAGRILISEVKSRIARSESFSFETTMSGKTWLPILREAESAGFETNIYFLFLDSIEKSIERIARRVVLGGHAISNEAVIRRYPRCFANFWHHYRVLANNWYVFDNSNKDPRLVITKSDFDNLTHDKKEKFIIKFLEGKACA